MSDTTSPDNNFIAAMVMVAAGPAARQRGGVGVRTGVGVYTLTTDVPINVNDCVVSSTPQSVAGIHLSVDHTSDTVKTFRTFDAAGLAADAAFSCRIDRLSWGTYE